VKRNVIAANPRTNWREVAGNRDRWKSVLQDDFKD